MVIIRLIGVLLYQLTFLSKKYTLINNKSGLHDKPYLRYLL